MKRAAWVIVLLQLAVLLGLVAEREWIRARGDTVWLRTAPVDPRDLFRGDYVQLEYDIAQPTAAQWQSVQAAADEPRQTVYARLSVDADGLAQLAALSLDKPAHGPFIRGRIGKQVQRDWRHRGRVKYGIEKYFVPQGEGLALEQRRGERDGWQTPMEVAVALSSRGTPVITGYRWSALSLRLEILERGERGTADGGTAQRRSPKLRFSLRNDNNTEHILLNAEPQCALALRHINHSRNEGDKPLAWAEAHCPPEAWSHLTLAPQASHHWDIDLADPAFFVQRPTGPVQLADIETWGQYRLIYTPPEGIDTPDGMPVWTQPLPSAAFNASGVVD